MNAKEFSSIRHKLDRSQTKMAQLLGVSPKAIQSFEQGWRAVPTYVERQTLFLLALKQKTYSKAKPCWIVRKCSKEVRNNCPAWEFDLGHFCWFVNGTICNGKTYPNWLKKIKICRQCEVFKKSISI
jgi:DNA-binding XRE family transcriptional regulator